MLCVEDHWLQQSVSHTSSFLFHMYDLAGKKIGFCGVNCDDDFVQWSTRSPPTSSAADDRPNEKKAQESDPENRNQRLTDEDFANMERKRSEESEDTKLRKKLDNQRTKTRNYKNSEAN